MNFSTLPVMSMMTRKLSWLSNRTELLAENISNADTPGYQARDLKPVSFRDLVEREDGGGAKTSGRLRPVVTQVGHMQSSRPPQPFRAEDAPDEFATKINGNDVGVEQQLMQLGETQGDYQLTLNLYRKQLDMLRLAIGRGR